jgi:hypothetical protein
MQISAASLSGAAQPSTSQESAAAKAKSTVTGTQVNVGSRMDSAIMVPFTTTIDGKIYSAEVAKINGQYEGSATNMPGADATGSNLFAVENRVGELISFYV